MSEIDALCACFGLRGQEGRFLAAVLNARGVAAKEYVDKLIRDSIPAYEKSKLLDVVSCRTRQKLARAFETDRSIIETVWNRGYRIAEDDKALIRDRAGIGAQQQEQAA